jgi:hypothetical protein
VAKPDNPDKGRLSAFVSALVSSNESSDTKRHLWRKGEAHFAVCLLRQRRDAFGLLWSGRTRRRDRAKPNDRMNRAAPFRTAAIAYAHVSQYIESSAEHSRKR